jgi:hypothetical protein
VSGKKPALSERQSHKKTKSIADKIFLMQEDDDAVRENEEANSQLIGTTETSLHKNSDSRHVAGSMVNDADISTGDIHSTDGNYDHLTGANTKVLVDHSIGATDDALIDNDDH